MDLVKSFFDKLGSDARFVLEQFNILTPKQSIWDQIEEIDYRVKAVAIILTTVALAFTTMIILANTFDLSPQGPVEEKIIQKPGAPAIPPPTEVVSLRIYPIKSCRGFEVDSTRLRKMGLLLDRNWMFITLSDKKFMTIRGDSSMTLIDTNVVVDDEKTKEQLLEISIHGSDASVKVPAFPSEKWLEANCKLQTVEIWEQETDGWVYNDEFNKIFSDFFGKPVALVYKGPTARLCRVNGSKEMYGEDIATNFGDVMSLQVASEASIKDLNKRLVKKNGSDQDDLTIERFRPNIIVRGRDDHPWEEDTWKRIRITTTIHEEEATYKLDLDAVARCARCQVPNVNPDTAEKNPKEPWDELMKFRRVDSGGPAKYKPCFGMLCIARNEGKIEVGAKVEVLDTTANHLYNTRKFVEL